MNWSGRKCTALLLPSVSQSLLRRQASISSFGQRNRDRRRRWISSMGVQNGKVTAPYGSWKSPITSDVVCGAEKRLGGTGVDSRGRLLLLESRPEEFGRCVLVQISENGAVDITPEDFSVRTIANEYGGGAFSVFGENVIFSNYKDQRLYMQSISPASVPIPITPDYGAPVVCYADGVFDKGSNRYITIREDRRGSSSNPTADIVTVDITESSTIHEPKTLVSGSDFYAYPRVDDDGRRVAWIQWAHPDMPWDKSQLWVGYISENGDICRRVCVCGGGSDDAVLESPTEPKWSPGGELHFINDGRNGFWNLCKWVESSNATVSLYPLDAEFSRPLWVFGMNSYGFITGNEGEERIVCSYRRTGASFLGVLSDAHPGPISACEIPFTDINNITPGPDDCFYIDGASAVLPLSIAKVRVERPEKTSFTIVWSSSSDISRYARCISVPELIEFPTGVPGYNAFAYFYPPKNPPYEGEAGERPPLLLRCHGGPTAESRGSLNLGVQYWTSRGWALADVNYGGSSGYGRLYRDRLLGRWGVVDVDDCCSCARFLAEQGMVDGERLCITGGSAGGYTALAALAFRRTFKAGSSLYGVADLKMLKDGTHKFESHYLDNLIGEESNYFSRSPINFVESFSCPVILFQGLDDKVVPPDQARKIYEALKRKGSPVALVEYEGEQHGFRLAENIKFTLEQQMLFFARVIGNFRVADDIMPVHIDNYAG